MAAAKPNMRTPSTLLRFLGSALMATLLAFGAAAGPRRFTVEDMLRLEDIGAVTITPIGRQVIFERLLPYKDAPEFGRTFLRGKDRTVLYLADLEKGPEPRLLLGEERDVGYWLGPLAPDGKRAAVFWIEKGKVGAGVVELASGKLVPFPFTPEITIYGPSPVWISNTELVYVTLADGEQPLYARVDRHDAEILPALWRQAWSGTAATASVLGSGRFRLRGPALINGALVRVDAITGAVRVLGSGYFTGLTLSPEGRRLAALRHLKHSENDQREDLFRAFPLTAGLEAELIVFDLAASDYTVCDSCRPFPGMLDWSSNGRRLLFFAADAYSDGENRLMTFSLPEATASPVPLDGLRPVAVNDKVPARFRAFWIDDGVAVYAIPNGHNGNNPGPDGLSGADRGDWYFLLPDHDAVNLTAAFPSARRRLIARTRDAVFMMSNGNLWRIATDGTRHNLTANIVPRLISWVSEEWAQVFEGPPRPKQVTLMSTETSHGRDIFLFNLENDEFERTAILPQESTLLAVSAEKQVVVARSETSSGSRLELRGKGQAPILLARFNRHLKNVVPGIPVRLQYDRPDGRALTAWLLLPPFHQQGQRHPTVVSVYPGAMYDGPWRWQTSTFSLFNPHLLAGRGYAVLLPSLPLGPEGKPGSPLAGLAEAVVPAVEQAVKSGYSDPDRLGLFGHSYGGYGVLGIIAQTDRFKAAVASASAGADLISVYGQFDVRRRTEADPVNILPSVRWAERGQGRMGLPPWRDPERYRRNSPLFYADRIGTPLMLIHGDLDLWPITQAEEMFTALYRLNKDAVLVRYWGEGHVLTSPANIQDYWHRIFDWYDQHLDRISRAGSGPGEEKRAGAPKGR